MIYTKTSFEYAKAIWIKRHEKEMNRSVLFETNISKGKDTVLQITAQNSYQLLINEEFVFHGPSRASHGFYRVDKINIERYLTRDNNRILVVVNGYHCNNFYLINQQAFLCAEFIDGNTVFNATGSDQWKAYLYTEKLQRVQRYAFQRPFCEVYDFTLSSPLSTENKKPLETVEYDINSFIEREVSYPKFPMEQKKRFIESGFVKIAEPKKKFAPWWTGEVGKSYSGFLDKDLEFNTTNNIDSFDLNKTSDTSDGFIESNSYATVEMKNNLTGLIYIDLYCNTDTTVYLTFDELLSGGRVDYARMDCINVITYKLKGGMRYRLITMEPYTFKYMNIISMGGRIELNELYVIKTEFNEDEIIKRLSPNADKQIERIYNSAVETFKQNTYDIYMDCPSRERAGWLCDSFFTSRVEYLLSGKSTVEHAFLSNFLMNEQYPLVPHGMLPMCYPADHIDGNFIPNWAMWYVIELNEYFSRTGDRGFIDDIKDRIYMLLDYFKTYENKNGLLEKLRGWVFVEWSKCNSLTRDINYPTNMLYYLFKKTIAYLYDDNKLENEAEMLKSTINKEAKIGLFYCDNAVYNQNGVAELSKILTETCQYYAFFTGVATKETDKELWDIMINDFGSKRKQNNKWENVHFSNAFIGNYLRLDLLMSAGLKNELEMDIRGYFDYMAKETGTLWEFDSPTASCNHGFASHTLIWLDYLGYIENK